MRLALALIASLLPLAAAQAAPPPANTPATPTSPTARVDAPAASVPPANKPAETPKAPAGQNPNPPAAQPTPTPTTPSFQFDMSPSSVYTACQTQDVIWHYRPEPEKKKVTLYVYDQAALEADPGFAVEATAGVLGKPSPNQRRSAPLEEIVKRQASAGKGIAHRIAKDWPANVAYSWVVDVPPGQYKFLAIVDGAGADIDKPLTIIGDSNMTCVKDFGAANPVAQGSSSAGASSGSLSSTPSGTKDKASTAVTSTAGDSTTSRAAGAAATGGSQEGSEEKSGGVSGGAIAGIVIGVLAGLALLGLLAFCWRKKRRNADRDDYHADPYSEPVREVRGGGFAPMAPSNDHDSVHQSSSFGHDDVYGGMVGAIGAPPRAAQNPFETQPSTPVEHTQSSHQTHTPNSSTGNASVYTAPMSAESELAYPPPVGLAPPNNRASAQSGTSTFESAHTQAHPGSIQTFGHQSERMSSFPSNRTLASDASHFVPSADAPPVPVPVAPAPPSPTKAAPPPPPAPTSPQRLPPAPPSPQRLPPAPISPQHLAPGTSGPVSPDRFAAHVAGGAPVPSAFAGAAPSGESPTLERKVSSRRKPVPRLSEDEEAALGTSPPKTSPSDGSPNGSAHGHGSTLRLPRAVPSSGDGHDDWGSGLEAALSTTRKEYTLTADPPLHQD